MCHQKWGGEARGLWLQWEEWLYLHKECLSLIQYGLRLTWESMALPYWPGAKTSIGKAYLSGTEQRFWNPSVPMHSGTFRCIQMHSEECWTCGRGGVTAWVPAVDESELRVKNICCYCYPCPSPQWYWPEAASQSEMDKQNPTNGSPHDLSPRDFESWALGRECGMVGSLWVGPHWSPPSDTDAFE